MPAFLALIVLLTGFAGFHSTKVTGVFGSQSAAIPQSSNVTGVFGSQSSAIPQTANMSGAVGPQNILRCPHDNPRCGK